MAMTAEKKTQFILNGNLWKVILILAIPIALTSTVNSLFGLFDAFFASYIGKTELAAISFVTPINQLVSSVGIGISVATTTLIARHVAKKDYESSKKYLGQLVSIALVFSAIITIFCAIFAQQILFFLGATDNIIEISVLYFRLNLLIVPLNFIIIIYKGLLSSQGFAKIVLILSLLMVILKFIFNLLLIITLQMGVLGLGIATLLGTLSVFVYAIYKLIFDKKETIRLHLRYMKFNPQILLVIFIVAVPIIIEKSTMSFGHVLMSRMALGFGEVEGEQILSAYAMTNKINTTAFSTVSGIGSGIVVIVSQNLAIGNVKRVKETFVKALIIGLITATLLLSIIFTLHIFLAKALSADSPAIEQHIKNAVRVYSMSVIPWAVFQVATGMYQGMGKTIYPLIISVLRLWIFRIALIWTLINVFNVNEYAIWYGMLISNILAMIVALVLLKTVKIQPPENLQTTEYAN